MHAFCTPTRIESAKVIMELLGEGFPVWRISFDFGSCLPLIYVLDFVQRGSAVIWCSGQKRRIACLDTMFQLRVGQRQVGLAFHGSLTGVVRRKFVLTRKISS